MLLHCEICRTVLPNESENSYCDKYSCQTNVKARKILTERIKTFLEFFKDHAPTEGAYKEYLEMVGLEEIYTKFACPTIETMIPRCSRRVWFHLNVIQAFQYWPDERGNLRHED